MLNSPMQIKFIHRITEQMAIDQLIEDNDKSKIMRTLLLRHKHVSEYQEKTFRPFRRSSTYSSLQVKFYKEYIIVLFIGIRIFMKRFFQTYI